MPCRDETFTTPSAARLFGRKYGNPVVALKASGIIRDVPSAADLVPRILAEAEQTIRAPKHFAAPSYQIIKKDVYDQAALLSRILVYANAQCSEQ